MLAKSSKSFKITLWILAVIGLGVYGLVTLRDRTVVIDPPSTQIGINPSRSVEQVLPNSTEPKIEPLTLEQIQQEVKFIQSLRTQGVISDEEANKQMNELGKKVAASQSSSGE